MMRLTLFILVVGLCHDASKATECNSRGRFPNNDEADCRGYTMCLPMGGTFMQYKLTCPLGSVYSHVEQQCTTSTSYRCLPSYVCNNTGSFQDSMNENCTSFISCVQGLSDFVTARKSECPASQVFSPGEGICVNETEYICKPAIETTTVTFEVTELSTAGSENAIDSFQGSRETPLNSVGDVRSNVFIVIVM
ncbi:Uncharacterized protein OBRU01_25633, partial [Operophtera brumata]